MKLRILTGLAAAGAMAFSLSACGGNSDSTATTTTEAKPPAATTSPDVQTPLPTEATGNGASTTAAERPRVEIGARPDWAINPLDAGDLVGTTHTDSWQIDFFQVGTVQSTAGSNWTDAQSGENLLPGNSPLVVVNVVFTNITDAPITVGTSLGSAAFRTDDWEPFDDMPGEDMDQHFEQFGLYNRAIDYDKVPDVSTASLPVDPGQSAAKPVTVLYTPGMKARAKVFISPVDAQGAVDTEHSEKSPDDFYVTFK